MGYRTIVVGTDGSDTSIRGMDKAAKLAKAVEGKLLVVCATANVGLHDYRAMEILSAASDRLKTADKLGVTASTAAPTTEDHATIALLKDRIRTLEADNRKLRDSARS